MWTEENQQRAPLLDRNGADTKSSEHGRKYEYDPGFKGVKETGRTVNDVVFGILFILVIAVMVAIAVLGFVKGNPSRLVPSNEWSGQAEGKAEYWFQDAVAVMKRDVDILAAGLGLSFLLALGWIQLMKYFTKLFIYLTLILGFLAVIALGVFFIHLGYEKGNTSLKITSYVTFGIAGLLILVVILLRKKIALTSALFAECCKGFQNQPSIILVGIVVFAIMAAFMVFWVAQFVYLYSIPGESIQLPDAPPKFNQKIRNLMYFQVFAFFWVGAFLTAVFQVSVAGGIATWYFSRDLDGYRANAGSPAFRSFGRAVTYHFGSLALGSLLLATVQFINFILTATKKINRANRVIVFIVSCIQCLLSCVQGIVKFVNQFAYIYIAMHGDSFCKSAKGCFNLISRNMFSAVVVDFLGEFVLFVGKLLGTAVTTMFTVGISNHLGRQISPVTATVAALTAYRVFSLFASIVHVGVDTIMVCYLEDLERNKEGALYMSPELHRMLQDKCSDSNHGTNNKRVNH
eukprot:TRINITY_DN5704_c0_g2_i1.p1 TRINITY_DN5704_c0_g2~~TRINITY_DN5704_c0_g2_i1.p1  ORF type:complete len:517 (-),score=119.80 TRINITY_DN5704_c0_g2_i1:80-1630(-)